MNKFTKAKAAIILIVAAIIVAGCNKPDEPNNGGSSGNNDSDVRVTTYMPQDITATTAKCGGDVIAVQGLSLNELGMCWSTERNPTVEDSHFSTTNWNAPYVCTITGLEPSTDYHVRAFALRGLVYYYGEDIGFTTQIAELPIVTTLEVTNIIANTAKVGGIVTSEGSSPVTERGVCWSRSSNPVIDDAHISSGSGLGTFNINLDNLEWHTTYYVRAYAENYYGVNYGSQISFTTLNPTYNGHEYIDLGLPSGTLWATCNVGANSPEGYGDYFAWGETQPKDYYDWSTYQHCDGTPYYLTKYCNISSYGQYHSGFVDNLTVLQPSDDAATANWGSGWCMPSKGQWEELYQNTTNTWTTQNGVNGRLFTANNGNSLFLPAAGRRWAAEFCFVGYYGDYWSSSLDTGYPSYAWLFSFFSDSYSVSRFDRPVGRSVRAVRSAK